MRRIILLLVITALATSGCAVNIYKKSPKDKATIQQLSGKVEKLSELREKEQKEFQALKDELQRKLRGMEVKVASQERGIVITLANNILFDSGKATVKEDAFGVLDKIIGVIQAKAYDKNIGVEGHTDNIPIKHSSWKSNRELSTSRANNVYHYLVKGGLNPSKLTTIGHGEYRPIASNDTGSGRAKNRRVEIVILPKYSKKSAAKFVAGDDWVK